MTPLAEIKRQTIRLSLAIVTCFGLSTVHPVFAEFTVNLPTPVTSAAQDIQHIHQQTVGVLAAIWVLMCLLIIYSVWAHRKSRGVAPDLRMHQGAWGKWAWLLFVGIGLALCLRLAGFSHKTLEKHWRVPEIPMLEVMVIGHQWWWEFVYLSADVKVESRYLKHDDAPEGLYLRAVDNNFVLPVNTPIKFLHTSGDVLHTMWVPELGFKKAAIPGFITQTWIAGIKQTGLYRGQCAQMCGTNHAYMPVVVEAVSQAQFKQWLAQKTTTDRRITP